VHTTCLARSLRLFREKPRNSARSAYFQLAKTGNYCTDQRSRIAPASEARIAPTSVRRIAPAIEEEIARTGVREDRTD